MAPHLDIRLTGDRALEDVADRVVPIGEPFRVALLEGGMASGKHAVMIAVKLPDGRIGVAQTSFDLFFAAAQAFATRVEMDGGTVNRVS